MQLHLFNFMLFPSSFKFVLFEYEFQLIQLFGLLLSFIEISKSVAKDSHWTSQMELLSPRPRADFYKSEQ